jgi:hypothetical protein
MTDIDPFLVLLPEKLFRRIVSADVLAPAFPFYSERVALIDAGQVDSIGKVCQTGATRYRITGKGVKSDRTAKCGICGIPMHLDKVPAQVWPNDLRPERREKKPCLVDSLVSLSSPPLRSPCSGVPAAQVRAGRSPARATRHRRRRLSRAN